jgi:hypothetical protein
MVKRTPGRPDDRERRDHRYADDGAAADAAHAEGVQLSEPLLRFGLCGAIPRRDFRPNFFRQSQFPKASHVPADRNPFFGFFF